MAARSLLCGLLLCLPLIALGWERSSTGSIQASQNYVNSTRNGQVLDQYLMEVKPQFAFGVDGARTHLAAAYALRGQIRTPGLEGVAYHQLRVDGERRFWHRRLVSSINVSRTQSILTPDRGLVSDYLLSGGQLRDVDQVGMGLRWQSRLSSLARLHASADWSENRYGATRSRSRRWRAGVAQGTFFTRILWGVSASGSRTESGGRLSRNQYIANGGVVVNRHWILDAQVMQLDYDRPSVQGQAVAGGGRVYQAGVRFRANRRAALNVNLTRGYFGRGVVGGLNYRHRRLVLQAHVSRNLVNGLSTLSGGGTGGTVGGLPGVVPPGAGGQPSVGVLGVQNALYISHSAGVSLSYRGRRLSQGFSFQQVRYESEATGSVSRYDDWSLTPGWRLGRRTHVRASVGGRRFQAEATPTVRLSSVSLGVDHSVGRRTRLSFNGSYYRQAGGVRRNDLRISLQLDYRWWP